MSDFIAQNDFNLYQGKGIAGAISRTDSIKKLGTGIAGEDLHFGDGVYFDYEDKTYKIPHDEDTIALTIGVVYQDRTLIHKMGENAVILKGDEFYFHKEGNCYVNVSEDVVAGESASFDKATKLWGVKAPSIIPSSVIFDTDGTSEDVVSVRLLGQIMSNHIVKPAPTE